MVQRGKSSYVTQMQSLINRLNTGLDALWNRGLPDHIRIQLRLLWPLLLLPVAFVNQLLTPHPVWVVVLVTVASLYGIAYLWVRSQARTVLLERRREGMLLAAGDHLVEHFTLTNHSFLPLLWAEFVDGSNLPGYEAGRVVACNANSRYSWQAESECRQRGVFRLGPARLSWTDPFALFRVDWVLPDEETVLIYPRVAHLPELQLPHGSTSGERNRQRPLFGSVRSTSVREYRAGDSLRHIHWPSTARRNSLMVTELDTEPGGEVWIVLDLNRAVHSGEGESGTFEHSIVVAASLAAQLLSSNLRQAVGLITTAAHKDSLTVWDPYAVNGGYGVNYVRTGVPYADGFSPEMAQPDTLETVVAPPQTGQAQLWRILSELAPVQPVDVPLTTLLRTSQSLLGSGRTVVVITPQLDPVDQPASVVDPAVNSVLDEGQNGSVRNDGEESSWAAELVHVQSRATGAVLLIAPGKPLSRGTDSTDSTDSTDVNGVTENVGAPGTGNATSSAAFSEGQQAQQESGHAYGDGYDAEAVDASVRHLENLLAHYEIPVRTFYSGQHLPTLATHTRTRRIIRSTPTGGAVSVEIEEEVG